MHTAVTALQVLLGRSTRRVFDPAAGLIKYRWHLYIDLGFAVPGLWLSVIQTNVPLGAEDDQVNCPVLVHHGDLGPSIVTLFADFVYELGLLY